MFQRWESLLFAHYPVPEEALRPLIPASVELDQCDGSSWVSITPLAVTGLRARGLPAIPGLSAFPELNVRTYVTRDGRPGVYFFSLDAGNAAAVAGARLLYHLPYYRARMRLRHFPAGAHHFTSRRAHRPAPLAEFRARYRPVGPPRRSAPGSLDEWLTERYCLYAVGPGDRLYRTEIHHGPWLLQGVEAAIDRNTMAQAARIPLAPHPARLAFADRQDVLVWLPERLT